MLIAFLTEFIQKHPGYDDYPDWQVSPQEAIDRKLKSWPDVVPEELTGEWMEFLSTKSEHIIRTNLGLYLKSSLAMFVQMVFGFDKDALCHILKLTPSDARISDIGRKLITGKFREGLQRLGKVQMVEWVGLFWSALYAIPIPIFAVIGLYAMCDNAPTLGRLSSF